VKRFVPSFQLIDYSMSGGIILFRTGGGRNETLFNDIVSKGNNKITELRNDFIFDRWLWHDDLYRVSPFQVYRTSTACLQCDLEFFMGWTR
jgi:hypothetical protein